MEIKLNIGYKQIMKLIRQMPASQVARLKAELDDKFLAGKSKAEITDLQQMLLEAPVMTDDQYKVFLENRKKFSQWR
ncbi:MAG: hypothetical protein KDD36_11055 [Flavobacteriales bacterium]|nr:hypothetical protein [Flavobacteriales bacterium]